MNRWPKQQIVLGMKAGDGLAGARLKQGRAARLPGADAEIFEIDGFGKAAACRQCQYHQRE